MKMKKILILFLLFSVCFLSFSQDIFDLVKKNDYKSIKKYKGEVNLQDDYKATPLMWAIYVSNLKTVKRLIKKGADVNQKGWLKFVDTLLMTEFMYGSCLVIAAGENKMDILEYLIEKQDVKINDREINLYDNKENGWTALHWAAAKGNNNVVRYLIKKGAYINIEAETDYNQTPLLFALKYKKNKTARLLIDLGADINKQDSYENSPLLYAFHHKNREMVKYLVEKGARPGIQGLNINDLINEYFGVGSYSEL